MGRERMFYKVFVATLIMMFAIGPVPVLAGSFGHVQQNNSFDVILKRVEFDARYFQGLDGYYSVGEELRLQQEAQNINELQQILRENARMQGQIEMLLKVLSNQKVDIPEQGPKPEPEPQPQPEPEPEPGIEPDPEPYKPTELDVRVYHLFKQKCARCHGDTKQDGGLSLIRDGALQLVPLEDRTEIHDRVHGVGLSDRGKAKMPKGGSLSDKEVEDLRLWMVQESDRLRSLRE
jgi:hypothetical protein